MDNMEWREKLEELEKYKLDCYLAISKIILEAVKSGRSSESVFVDFSGMKERYLKALYMYEPLGLTSVELYPKKMIWLERPGESTVFSRVKTVSMFLIRLHRASLVHRKREGHGYRYFISMNGRKRLNYYENLGKRKGVR